MNGSRNPLLFVLLGTFLLTACAPITRPALERRHYLLEAVRPEMQVQGESLDAVLAVRTLRVAAGFDSKPFITVRGQGRVEADFQHHFFLQPGEMITGLVRQWLGKTRLFAHVTDLGSLKEPDLILEGFVPVLSRDFSSGSPKAVLAVQFLLLRPGRDAVAQIVLQRDYRQEVSLRGASAQELIQGWSQALMQILGDFEADLRQALDTSVIFSLRNASTIAEF